MKIVVYGLGIIGASVCASLKRAGYTVFGMNRSPAPVAYALSHGMIDGEAKDFVGADVVFLALPPSVTETVLRTGNFPKGCIVSDVCGVKVPMERAVFEEERTYRYVGVHPMAGKETTGITSASESLFDGANFVLVKNSRTDERAYETVEALARAMGFGRIVVCNAAEHDRMIALTSQLAHIASSAYVKSDLSAKCTGFTGGSFQDMTRVAPMDEGVWTELFLLNREALIPEIARLREKLSEYEAALLAEDGKRVEALIREGKEFHAKFAKNAAKRP